MLDSEVISRAQTYINAEGKIQSTSISRDPEAGELNYTVQFSDGDEEENNSAVSDYNINYTPSLYGYGVQNTLCGALIYKSKCPKRGSVDISVTAISGTGWNYVEKASEEATKLSRTFGGQHKFFRIDNEDLDYSDDKTSVTKKIRASFLGGAVNDTTTISSMF
jgi:hypothetical protein